MFQPKKKSYWIRHGHVFCVLIFLENAKIKIQFKSRVFHRFLWWHLQCDLSIVLAFIQMWIVRYICSTNDKMKIEKKYQTIVEIKRRYFWLLCAIYVIEAILCASFWFSFLSPPGSYVFVFMCVALLTSYGSEWLLHEIIIMVN